VELDSELIKGIKYKRTIPLQIADFRKEADASDQISSEAPTAAWISNISWKPP